MDPQKSRPGDVPELTEVGVRTIAGNFQCQMQVTQTRTLVVTGYIYSDDTPAQINKRLDDAQDAIDRQFVRCDIINKEAQREATLQAIKQHRDQLDELRALQGGTGDGKRPKLNSQQLEILKRGDESLRTHQKNIEILDSMIAAAKAKLGA